tara:strand:- start:391 stop:612 length:222 start_codon:yes stop_codon:yes gene_type:complete
VKENKKSKRFEGSMRQKRGRVLKMLLMEKNVTKQSINKELEVTNKITDQILDSLMKDNLITISKNKVIVISDN